MGRTILSVAYPLTEVGLDAAGGSEQILALLDEALVESGDRSIVLAAEGSKVRGELIASPRANGHLDDEARAAGREAHRWLLHQALNRYPVDLVHMHSLDFHHYLPANGVPVLATLHLPADWYPQTVFHPPASSRVSLNCVSNSQFRHCPPTPALLPPVTNGVPVERFKPRFCKEERGRFALALGRVCPEKGFHFALEAAHMAKVPMLLAGRVFPLRLHLDYYRDSIKPWLDRDRRFLGPVGFAQKSRILAQAKCLLIPSTVEETSSLVAMEALACGTPVIAFRSGALPEIIEHGKTGLIVNDVREMAQALAEVDSLDGRVCRQVAESRYDARDMIGRYLSLYDQLLAQNEMENAVCLSRCS